MKEKFDIEGMTCSACSAAVEKAVRKLDGVAEANVNLLGKSLVVEFDPEKADHDLIKKSVSDAGYSASLPGERGADTAQSSGSDAERSLKRGLIISALLLVALMYVSMGHMVGLPLPGVLSGWKNGVAFVFTQILLTLPIVYINRRYFSFGFKALWHRSPNMDSLVAIGSGAALVYGIFALYMVGYGLGQGDEHLVHRYMENLYFESAAMILTLVSVGKYLEERSKGKTSDAIKGLIKLAPETALVIREGAETEIKTSEITVGDIIIIKPGGRIPVDGVITEGSSAVDESALTGESIPREKAAGDTVMSASINKTGSFKMKATRVGGDTTLARIIELVENAGATKAPIAKLADKISGIFVPAVITIAVLAGIVWAAAGKDFEFSLSVVIAVLVISCPCALGLATPVAITVAAGRSASRGILIKSAEALETAHAVDTVVMDKTGTLTEGKPSVTDIVPAEGYTEEELLSFAASLEKPSEHPLAEAIVRQAEEKGIQILAAAGFAAVPGRGVNAEISGKRFYAGNEAYMNELGADISALKESAATLSAEGKTPMYFAEGKRGAGLIAAADTVRPTSAQAVSALKELGVEVVMLTGDNAVTAEAVRKRLDISRVISDVLPDGKEEVVRGLMESGKRVAMVGDGINDSPALARADVGIAIGAGTDIAIESAGIVLMRSDPRGVAELIKYSRATFRNIKQNLFWAFFYNTLGIPLAAGVLYPAFGLLLSPMIGAAAMSLSSVFVVTNALRLYKK